MTRRRFSLLSLLTLAAVMLPLLAGPAAAQSLEDLRAAGKVGESYTGYAVARDPSAKDLVDQVNAKRREIYEAQAKKQGVKVTQVGAVYAAELLQKLPAGTWFLTADGEWRKK